MAASTTFISTVVFSELKHGRFTSFQHARSSHICLQVLQWWTCTGGPKLGADLRLCFLFLYLSYIERQIVEREASSVKRGSAADTPGGTTQNAPGLMTTGSDSILTTRDEVTLGSVLQKKIKSAEWKKKKKSLMSEIYIVQAFPPINFGSPWVFPGKFNLRVSEPFTLNSPRRRCFIRVICCPRSPLNLVRKDFLWKRLFFLEMKLCFSRLKGTWKWTLNSELLRPKTESGSSFRFPTQGVLVLATSQERVRLKRHRFIPPWRAK